MPMIYEKKIVPSNTCLIPQYREIAGHTQQGKRFLTLPSGRLSKHSFISDDKHTDESSTSGFLNPNRIFFASAYLSSWNFLRTASFFSASATLISSSTLYFTFSFEFIPDGVHVVVRKHHKATNGSHEKNWSRLQFINAPMSLLLSTWTSTASFL